MIFADFLLDFKPKHAAAVKARCAPGRLETLHVGDAILTISTTQRGKELFKEEIGANWHCWCFGELSGYRGTVNLGIPFLRRVTDDLEASCFEPLHLNGHFILLAYHQPSENWHVWVNRMGTYHAYYANDGEHTALGTFFPAVAEAASRRQLDWAGLTGFFACGFFLQDRTSFSDVRILRPATHTIFDRKGRIKNLSRYWDWKFQPNSKRSFDDTVVEFGETLGTILKDQTATGDIAIPISSGLDSRTTAAIVTASQPELLNRRDTPYDGWPGPKPSRFWSYSYGYTDYSAETVIASRIATARNLAFQRFTIPDYLFDGLELILASVEGFQNVTSTRQAAIGNEVAAHSDYLLAAHWGDVWMDDMGFLDEEGKGSLGVEKMVARAVHKLKNRGSQGLLEHLCKPQLCK